MKQTKAAPEISELVIIANLQNDKPIIPNFAKEIELRFIEKTGKPLQRSGKDYFGILSEVWREMETDFPELAEYAIKGHETDLSFYFQEILESDEQTLRNENVYTAYKLQNFIRAAAIRNNLRLIAYLNRVEFGNYSPTFEPVDDKPPVFLSKDDQYTGWQDDAFSILDSRIFSMIHKDKNGLGVPVLTPMVRILEGVEIARFKTCLVCHNIFWAVRTDAKYCSDNCSATARQRAYYQRKKANK